MAAMDDKDAFMMLREMQAKYSSAVNALNQMESFKRQHEISLRRAAFTAAQLDAMPEDTTTYAAVGKAYVLTPKADIMVSLEAGIKTADAELKAVASKKAALASTVSQLEEDMDRLVKNQA